MTKALTLTRIFAGAALLSLLSACFPGDSQLPVSGDELNEAVAEVLPNARVVQLDDQNVLQFSAEAGAIPSSASVPGRSLWVYRVGPATF
jgi:polysaccharide export outer membrane protein